MNQSKSGSVLSPEAFYQPALFRAPGRTSKEEAMLRAYDEVTVPESLVTGELDADPIVYAIQESFFDDIARSLNLGRLTHHVLRRERGMILPPQSKLRETDDYIDRLSLDGGQTLASAERHRDDFNFMIVQFAKYALTSQAIQTIATIHGYLAEDRENQEDTNRRAQGLVKT